MSLFAELCGDHTDQRSLSSASTQRKIENGCVTHMCIVYKCHPMDNIQLCARDPYNRIIAIYRVSITDNIYIHMSYIWAHDGWVFPNQRHSAHTCTFTHKNSILKYSLLSCPHMHAPYVSAKLPPSFIVNTIAIALPFSSSESIIICANSWAFSAMS